MQIYAAFKRMVVAKLRQDRTGEMRKAAPGSTLEQRIEICREHSPLAERVTGETPQPPDARRASPLFSQQILQRHVVEHRVGQHPLQPSVLVLQRLQPLGLRHVEPAEPGLPLVECRLADPMPPADIRRRNTRLLLPQDRDDLLFREP